jgi:hypothetical protein
MSRVKKNIQVGQYWRVKYRKYEDIVLVKEVVPEEDGFSCIVSQDIDRPYVNYFSGELFKEQDFVEQLDKKCFYISRSKFLMEETTKCLKIAAKE